MLRFAEAQASRRQKLYIRKRKTGEQRIHCSASIWKCGRRSCYSALHIDKGKLQVPRNSNVVYLGRKRISSSSDPGDKAGKNPEFPRSPLRKLFTVRSSGRGHRGEGQNLPNAGMPRQVRKWELLLGLRWSAAPVTAEVGPTVIKMGRCPGSTRQAWKHLLGYGGAKTTTWRLTSHPKLGRE